MRLWMINNHVHVTFNWLIQKHGYARVLIEHTRTMQGITKSLKLVKAAGTPYPLPSVPVALEVKVQLKDVVVELTTEAMAI